MKVESVVKWGGRVTGILTLAVCLGVAVLIALGYRATHEWRRSSALLIERQTTENADLLLTALTRDMRGAQSWVLANHDWGEFSVDSPHYVADQVETAFARYPYPESFFGWRQDSDRGAVFFNRANRQPAWMPADGHLTRYPVLIVTDPVVAGPLRARVESYAAARRQYAVFDIELAEQPYQIIARLVYDDPFREHLQSVGGFTVNMKWARRYYFSEIISQVARIADSPINFDLAVVDERGQLVWGTLDGGSAITRDFPLLFVDPSVLGPEQLLNLPLRNWTIRVSSARDPTLIWATQGADRTLLAGGAAAIVLVAGLVLAIRAVRVSARLTEMRSDFVSSVTHELKTPLANIRALAGTLARRPTDVDTIRDYVPLLVKEEKRLTRIVDNLLAYARVTDVTDVYSFEPIAIAELVDDVIRDCGQQLSDKAFEVKVEIPADLPPVRADRSAMLLALDNLIENAIRYSAANRSIRIAAWRNGIGVSIEVKDCGLGIPAEELSAVRRKFVRGRFARADGSGLGLAIVSRVVADHSGTFLLESELGAGTTGRIVLPVAGD